MGQRTGAVWLSGLALALLLYATAVAAESSDLAQHAATQLRQELPTFDVVILDPRTLRLDGPEKTTLQVNLDRIQNFCAENEDSCDVVLADFTSKIAQSIKQQFAPLTLTSLRAAVRPQAMMEGIKHQLGDRIGSYPVTAPFVGGLLVACYFDMPTATRIVTAQDIQKLGLSHDQAITACENNVKPELPALTTETGNSGGQGVIAVPDFAYSSSWLIFHDAWAPIARKFNGNLIVSVPGSNLVLYSRGQDSGAFEAFATLTKERFEKAERPISPKVFRWTSSGWDVVPPD